jgi:hypothetical protein
MGESAGQTLRKVALPLQHVLSAVLFHLLRGLVSGTKDWNFSEAILPLYQALNLFGINLFLTPFHQSRFIPSSLTKMQYIK